MKYNWYIIEWGFTKGLVAYANGSLRKLNLHNGGCNDLFTFLQLLPYEESELGGCSNNFDFIKIDREKEAGLLKTSLELEEHISSIAENI